MAKSTILLTGTGLVSKKLSILLTKKGYQVNYLSRTNSADKNVYFWDYKKEYIEKEAIETADYIIHLAGANIAGKRWSKRRKEEIISSRVATANLLYQQVKEINPNLKAFISASATGYYGAITSEQTFKETDESQGDFLGTTCNLWEKAAMQFNDLGVRTVTLRTGIVISKEGGVLEKMTPAVKKGIGPVMGSGMQYMPWIHIDDLCSMYLQAVETVKMIGPFNAVAPESVNNKDFMKALVNCMSRYAQLIHIPSFILKLFLGEMSAILLSGSKVSCEKIKSTGFQFKYPDIKTALCHLE